MFRKHCITAIAAAAVFGSAVTTSTSLAQSTYFPPRGDWERRSPEQLDIDPGRLELAIEFSIASESSAPADMEVNHALAWAGEPHNDPLGPFRVRGPQTGIIVKNGYIVAEWGDISRVDMTHSVTKSLLSSTVGLAFDRGLISSVHDRVRDYFAPIVLPPGDGEPGHEEDGNGTGTPRTLFESEHNRQITWNHLLRQTSDWEGTLWGKPDWADRPGDDVAANRFREHNDPGTVYKYNDVRVNVLALAALQVWRRPLPEAPIRSISNSLSTSYGVFPCKAPWGRPKL